MEVVQQDRCRSSLNRKARRKSKMKILKKLKPEERGLTRTLWEQVFTEDTKEFLDYYYTEKTKNNEIYVIETDHDIRAMMQLNPYVIQMGKKAVESRYIVAVATEPLYRHRGYMAELLSKTARDLYQQKMPFFFLMPASEKIYYPHNYRFIYAADVWSAKGTDGKELTIQKIVELQNDSGVRLRKAEEKDCKKLGDFAEEVLEKQKIQVYTKRDAAYYMRLLKEQESEKGGILIAEQDGEMRGILVFDEEDGLAVREPLIRKGYEDVFDKAGVILKKEETKKVSTQEDNELKDEISKAYDEIMSGNKEEKAEEQPQQAPKDDIAFENEVFKSKVKAFKQERNQQNLIAVLKMLSGRKFLLPSVCNVEDPFEKLENGNVRLKEGTVFNPAFLTSTDKKVFLPIFTDEESMVQKSPSGVLLKLNFEQCVTVVYDEKNPVEAVVINPFTENMIIGIDLLKMVFKEKKKEEKQD